jgi:hypothetical protein
MGGQVVLPLELVIEPAKLVRSGRTYSNGLSHEGGSKILHHIK